MHWCPGRLIPEKGLHLSQWDWCKRISFSTHLAAARPRDESHFEFMTLEYWSRKFNLLAGQFKSLFYHWIFQSPQRQLHVTTLSILNPHINKQLNYLVQFSIVTMPDNPLNLAVSRRTIKPVVQGIIIYRSWTGQCQATMRHKNVNGALLAANACKRRKWYMIMFLTGGKKEVQ